MQLFYGNTARQSEFRNITDQRKVLWFVKILLDKNVTQCAIKPEEFCRLASVSTSLLRGMILSSKLVAIPSYYQGLGVGCKKPTPTPLYF